MSLLALPHILEWRAEHYNTLSASEVMHLQMILEKRIYELDTNFQDRVFRYKLSQKKQQRGPTS